MEIVYQVTQSGGPAGVVSARDFVLVSKAGKSGETFVRAGISTDFPEDGIEKDSGLVRATNGPGAMLIKPLNEGKCELVWLMDCQYNGSVPGPVLEIAMPLAQLQYVECVRKLAAGL